MDKKTGLNEPAQVYDGEFADLQRAPDAFADNALDSNGIPVQFTSSAVRRWRPHPQGKLKAEDKG